MTCRMLTWVAMAVSVMLIQPPASSAQGTAVHPTARNIGEMKFEPVPGMPACAPGAVLSGDPANGPSTIVGKLTTGCVIPWHYHTPNEQLMLVSGVAQIDVKDAEPITLRAGGFALMPSRHVHRFRCTAACLLFVHSDAPYDIHYVDDRGNEIPAGEALKAVERAGRKATTTKK